MLLLIPIWLALAAPPANPDVEALVAAGRAATTAKDWDTAVSRFTEALVLAPRDARALGGRGHAHYLAGRLPLARADLLAAVSPGLGTEDERAASWFNLAIVAEASGDPAGQLEALLEAQALRPSQPVQAKLDALIDAAPPLEPKALTGQDEVDPAATPPERYPTLGDVAAQGFPTARATARLIEERVCKGKCKGGPWLHRSADDPESAKALVAAPGGFTVVDAESPGMANDGNHECGEPEVHVSLDRIGPLHRLSVRTNSWWALGGEGDELRCQPAGERLASVLFDSTGTVVLRVRGFEQVGVHSTGRRFAIVTGEGVRRVSTSE